MNALVILAVCVAAAVAQECSVKGLNTSLRTEAIKSLQKALELEKEVVLGEIFHSSKKYGDAVNGYKRYLLSKDRELDVEKAIKTCELFGGYLSKIESAEEFNDVKEFAYGLPEECLLFDEIRVSGLYNDKLEKHYYHHTVDFDNPLSKTFIVYDKSYPELSSPSYLEDKKCLSITKDGYRNRECSAPAELELRILCEVPEYY